MKILLITNLFPNNKEPNRGIFIKQEVAELAKLCEIKVIAPVPWFPLSIPVFRKWSLNAQIVSKETIAGIETYHPKWFMIPKLFFFRPFFGFFLFISILSMVKGIYKNYKFDIIYAPWVYPDGFASVLLGRILKKPVVMHALGCDINFHTRFYVRRLMIKYCLQSAKKTIAVSSALKDKIESLGIKKDKVVIVFNGIDNTLFSALDSKKCREELKLPLDEKLILFVGSLEEVKGVEYLIRAFARIVPKVDCKIRLLMIGKGKQEIRLREIIQELSIEQFVTLVGEIKHDLIPKWMNAADLFCLPSIREGMPNVVLEALSCGKPVVATRVGGIPEVLAGEPRSVLVEPGDIESLSQGLEKGLFSCFENHGERSNRVISWGENANRVYWELVDAIKMKDSPS